MKLEVIGQRQRLGLLVKVFYVVITSPACDDSKPSKGIVLGSL